MLLNTYQYSPLEGWNQPLDPALDSHNTLVVVFGSSDINGLEHPLQQLTETYPDSQIIGCSTAGEIYADAVYDNSLSVAVARFEHSQLRVATARLPSTGSSLEAGEQLASPLATADLRAVFVLSDGLRVNGSHLIAGISGKLDPSVIVTGGLAGDAGRFEKTWILHNGQLQEGIICAVGFYGDRFVVSHGSKGGWDVLGPERQVTRSEDNVLYQLDGQPALDLYKKYLGERAEGLPSTGLLFPLAIRPDNPADGYTVRTILAIDEAQQSITFAGNIPQAKYVQLMRANFDRLIDGASQAAEDARPLIDSDQPVLCIAISCVGRRLVLGQRTDEELEATLESLPPNVSQLGFYSYGEISPLASGRCDLHNQTMTLSLFSES
jgi:hypothetical protein